MTDFTWHDTPGDDRDAVTLALPLFGADALDQPFACPLPGHARPERLATVSGFTLHFNCPDCIGGRDLRLVDVFAAVRMSQEARPGTDLRLNHALAVAWWGRLWIEAGALTLALPRIELDPACPNPRIVEKVLRGLLLLQGIHTQGFSKRPMPCDFTEHFAAAWCDVPPTAAWRALGILAKGGYVFRQKVKPESGGRARWRYELTGRGLVIERPEHALLYPTPTLLEAAA